MVGRSCYISATCFSTFYSGRICHFFHLLCVHLIKNLHESRYPPLSTVVSSKFVSLTYSLHSQYLVHSTLLVRIASVAISTCFYSVPIQDYFLVRKSFNLPIDIMENSVCFALITNRKAA